MEEEVFARAKEGDWWRIKCPTTTTEKRRKEKPPVCIPAAAMLFARVWARRSFPTLFFV
ncbi:hypothetical protein COLO4_32262 [Corchorus olitorius]|uniref:Uncharacterized protein n=1 Tax=Corchorus olitorius TaxID=93759 RepID=A0A1R3GZX9_9ROSI|nr:hypothetical protein COLO4_32262 [Corchorus olitorius]